MTRFYNDGFNDMERYRNWSQQFPCYDERPNPLQFPYAEGRSVRNAPHCRQDRLLPEALEHDQPHSNPTRRRIAVACSRCRKRKIKCSGDTGSGMGCQNCRTAGVGSCNFTRVGSLEVGMNQPSSSLPNDYVSPGNNERLHMLNAQAYHYVQPPLRLMTGNLPVQAYYPADGHYDADSHSDNYMLSPATPLTPNDPYAAYLPETTRNWSSYGNRYVSSASYSRYSGYESAPFPTELPMRARQAMTTMDGPNNVFSTHGLHMSLPNPMSNTMPNTIPGGRELPPPTMGGRVQAPTQSYEARPVSYSKAYSYWPNTQATAGARNGSITSSRSSELAAPMPQKPSVAASLSLATSPTTLQPTSTDAPNLSPRTTTAPTDHANNDISLPHHHGLGIEHAPLYGIPSASSSDTRLHHDGPASNTYTFSITRRDQQNLHGTPTGSDDGQIAGATTYMPIQYPDEPSSGRTYSNVTSRHGSTDARVHALSQRSSMPSIGQNS